MATRKEFLDKTGLGTVWGIIKSALGGKVDKVSGKGLSTNDYTTAEKNKLAGIAEGANVANVAYDTANKKITKTINGTTSDVVSVATLKTDLTLSKDDIGLGNVENKSSETIRSELTSENVTNALGYTPINTALKGANNGVAELDSTGKVPSAQLPSYVDDVLEYNTRSDFPATGESGKIYIAKDTNLTYRWGGSEYAEISSSLALGETSSTAYRGDRGKAAYDHATAKGSAFASGMYKIATNAEGHVTGAIAVEKSDITGLGIPGQDTTYESKSAVSGGTDVSLVTTGEKYTWNSKADTDTATTSANGLMSAADKTKLDGIAEGATANVGTITGITMNGGSMGTSGVVDLGTVITSHQDISGKVDKVDGKGLSANDFTNADKSKLDNISSGANESTVAYDTTNKKITTTVDGTTSDVVSAATLKTDMALNNVENKSSATIRSEITSGNVTSALGYTPINSNLKGANNGLAELDENGKVPSGQLPSYVDDVEEYNSLNDFPATGESGKVYIAKDTNITYRWGGSEYVPIGSDLALGETSSTAYRGDRGAAAYAAAVTNVDSTPTENSTDLVTSGGVYAAVAEKYTKPSGGIPASDIASGVIPPAPVVMTGATSSENGTAGYVPAPSAGDQMKSLRGNGTWVEAGKPMVILSYGSSTWNDFINAYNDNVIVYCRASSNSNPATGNQTRMAFMAYVNSDPPTEVEFQYYRSVSSKSATQQGDQVFVYKLTSSGTWTVTTREASTKIAAGTNMSSSYSSGTLTLSADLSSRIATTEKGAASGVAELDANGKVPSSQLPSYVDDVIEGYYNTTDGKFYEENTYETEIPGEEGKIFISLDTNVTYRWSGSTFVAIGSDLALGETSSTAYRGDRGAAAYAAAVTNVADVPIRGSIDLITTGGVYTALEEKIDWHYNNDSFIPAEFNGFADMNSSYIWTDGNNIYYSYNDSQFVLDKANSCWKPKIWNGTTISSGAYIWTDGTNIYYSNNYNQYVLDKSTSTWNAKTWKGLLNFYGSNIWKDGDKIYYSSGSSQYELDKSTSTWSAKTWSNLSSFNGTDVWTDGENIYYSNYYSRYELSRGTSLWQNKKWTGIGTMYGSSVWTDGENIYYSSGSYQYVLDKSTSTWNAKTWNGLTDFSGFIWTDGDDYYYSYGLDQYVLDVSTSTWNPKTWNGAAVFNGNCIWTDGDNVYYSASTKQYVLDKSTLTWNTKTWNGLTSFSGDYVWTDGENIYFSSSENQYVLDKSTSTWSEKTWTGLDSFSGIFVWTDGNDIYYSSGTDQYVLDKSTSTWNAKTWTGLTSFSGWYIWTDGINIYYSQNTSTQYILDKTTSTWSTKTWTGLTNIDGRDIWTNGENVYYSSYGVQYVLDKTTSTWILNPWTGLNSFRGQYMWTDGENIYYSFGPSYKLNDTSKPQILFGTNGKFNVSPYTNLPGLLPSVSSSDNDKVLKVVNGVWTASEGGGGGGGESILREIPFAFATSDWTASGNVYTASIVNSAITTDSIEFATYDISINTGLKGYLSFEKNGATNTVTFTTSEAPTGLISGKLYTFANNESGVAVTFVSETIPVSHGGTGATTAAGAVNNLGIADSLLPDVTASDNGKILSVVNGAWAAVSMQAWQGGSY